MKKGFDKKIIKKQGLRMEVKKTSSPKVLDLTSYTPAERAYLYSYYKGRGFYSPKGPYWQNPSAYPRPEAEKPRLPYVPSFSLTTASDEPKILKPNFRLKPLFIGKTHNEFLWDKSWVLAGLKRALKLLEYTVRLRGYIIFIAEDSLGQGLDASFQSQKRVKFYRKRPRLGFLTNWVSTGRVEFPDLVIYFSSDYLANRDFAKELALLKVPSVSPALEIYYDNLPYPLYFSRGYKSHYNWYFYRSLLMGLRSEKRIIRYYYAKKKKK